MGCLCPQPRKKSASVPVRKKVLITKSIIMPGEKQEVAVESTEQTETTPEIKEKTVEEVKAKKEEADKEKTAEVESTEEKKEEETEGDKNDNASTEEKDTSKTEDKTDSAVSATSEKRSADEENGEDESPTKKVKSSEDKTE